jgi:hypothetical protein
MADDINTVAMRSHRIINYLKNQIMCVKYMLDLSNSHSGIPWKSFPRGRRLS